MAGMQEGMIQEILSDEFFSLGTIQIQFWATEMVNGAPTQVLEKILQKDAMFSLQCPSELQVQKNGFADYADNEYFVLYLMEELPIYNGEGKWFKIIVDGEEYLLRRAKRWRAYYAYWISRAAQTLNPM